eukprot:4432582-Prorocentrum_lima.AAC.1
MALAIKWHTAEHRWWRSPGQRKHPDLLKEIKYSSNTVPVYISPEPDNVLYFAGKLEVYQDWTFPNLPQGLQEQLPQCRP